MRVLAIIEGYTVTENDDGSVDWLAHARIDNDGRGPAQGDPDHQDDTSLHERGIGDSKVALNAQTEAFIVVPPAIIYGVQGIVLGCQAQVWNRLNGKTTMAVVGDIGPSRKIGEMSCKCAVDLGIDPNPNTGGEDRAVIFYRIWPGKPAEANGMIYELQPR